MVRIRGRKLFSRMTTVFIVLFLATTSVIPASAASIKEKREEARSVKNQIDSLSRGLNKLAGQYNATLSKLSTIEYEIVFTEKELDKAQEELKRNESNLVKRVEWLYKDGNNSFIDVIFGAESFEDFLVQMDTLVQVGQADGRLIKKIKAVKAEIERKKAELVTQHQKQEAVAANLRALGKQLNAKLAKQQAILSKVEGDLAKLIEEERAREMARARALAEASARAKGNSSKKIASANYTPKRVSRGEPTPPGYTRIGNFLFPVSGSYAFSNDWGQPRSGGRTHKGTDIFSTRGTPVVATVGGNVVQRSGGSAGLYTTLKGSDGNTYQYMHLNGYGKSGQVNPGDVIGYVGDSGNAKGTSPHLHFEIQPGGGGAVNPYPYLKGEK
ncbi:MAG TPA: peptidoglycan DD-metalloendopeptidase family protein [Candidatus Subteraquimicrobiales bacterium]